MPLPCLLNRNSHITKLIFLFFVEHLDSDFLQPLAVVQLDESTTNESSSLEKLATDSNSEMVYACDEFGNPIAVGVFVTESFSNLVSPNENSQFQEGQIHRKADPTWVGAVEECATNVDKVHSIDAEIEPARKPLIRVYKVNKGPNSRSVLMTSLALKGELWLI